jgi:hypothetical protein
VVVWKQISTVLDRIHIKDFCCDACLGAALKLLTEVYKKCGTLLTPEWKWFINLETLGGYKAAVPMAAFEKDLREWATGPMVHRAIDEAGEWSEDEFLKLLSDGVDDFFGNATNVPRANETGLTIDEYARYPGHWAKSGSSTDRTRPSYVYDDKVAKVKRTKWATALGRDPNWVRQILRDQDPSRLRQQNRAIQKRETGKVRAVVNSDLPFYIRMDYVGRWFESAMSGSTISTLFMSNSQTIDMWERLAFSTRDKSIKVPLDQSHFDYQQYKAMFRVAIAGMRKFMIAQAKPSLLPDLLHVLRSIEITLIEVPGVLTIPETNIRILIEKGVMSGWRWTALIDTLFNWAEMFVARRCCTRMGIPDPVISLIAQGDDDQVQCRSYGGALALVRVYALMGFEVNPGKFFMSTDRDEYLRQVVTRDEVCGYPARALNALLWRNPVSSDPMSGVFRLTEQLKSWNILLSRGADVRNTIPLMVRDLGQGNGLSRTEVISILRTPAAVGGLGFFEPDDTPWTTYTAGSARRRAKIIPSTILGLREEHAAWASFGVDSEPLTTKLAGDVLEMSNAKLVTSPSTLAPAERVRPFAWGIKPGLRAMPLMARMSDDLPPTLGRYVLDLQIRNRQWDWINNVWVDEPLRAISRQIMHRGGRGLWIDWLKGDLPWRLPTVYGWSDLVPSEVYRQLVFSGWSRLTSRGSYNKSHVKRLALTAEYQLPKYLALRPICLRG